MKLQRRRGFSAFELMVMLGIIAVLVALLLPAVSSVRETARRSGCQDNLHNSLIAIHNYESVHRVFPPGFVHQIPQRSNYGWQAMLLPYQEQAPLYNLLTPGRPGLAAGLTDTSKAKGLQAQITMLICPTEKGPALNSHFVVLDIDDKSHELATSSYVGNYGIEIVPLDLLPKEKRKEAGRPTGIFRENSNTRIASITDGTSNTIGLSERAWMLPGSTKEEDRCGAALIAGVTGDGKVIHQRSTLFSSKHGINATGANEADGTYCEAGVSSNHPGGIHAAMVDGRVPFLSETIDQEVFDAITQKDDGKAIGLP